MHRTLLLVLLACLGVCLTAAEPTLDPSFGDGGQILHSAPQWVRHHQQVVVDAQGRLVVLAFNAVYGGGGDHLLLRYLADGSRDADFGREGVMELARVLNVPPEEGVVDGTAIALTADGKLLLLWQRRFGGTPFPGLSRFTSSGELDSSFGTGGTVLFDAGENIEYSYLAVDGQGRAVVGGGRDYVTKIMVRRFTATGAADVGFAGGGRREVSWSTGTHISGLKPRLAAMRLDGSDRVLFFGGRYDAGNNELDLQLLRVTVAGAVDTSFSGDGFVRMNPQTTGGKIYPYDLGIDAAGRFVLLTREYGSSGYTSRLQRLTSAGAIDGSFAGGGRVLAPIDGLMISRDLRLADDGGVWVSGSIGPRPSSTTASGVGVWRFDAAGAPVAGFSGDGVATWVAPGMTVGPLDLVLTAAGPLVAGYEQVDGTYGYGLMLAFDAGGALRQDFGTAGVLRVLATENTRNQLASMQLLADGRILIGGSQWTNRDGNPQDGLLGRLLTDGRRDVSFGRDGWVAETDGWFAAAGVDGAGRIRCIGPAGGAVLGHIWGYNDVSVYRYLADGAPDAAFGSNGHRVTNLGARDDYAYEMVILADGSSVSACRDDAGGRQLLVRHAADGSLDPGFGSGGLRELDSVWLNNLIDVGGGRLLAVARLGLALVAVDDGSPVSGFGSGGEVAGVSIDDQTVHPECACAHGDGFLVGGYVGGNNASDGVLVRLRADGSLDPAFGTGGAVTGLGTEVTEVLLDGQGRILAAGHTRTTVVVARFAADGSPDAGFGTAGVATLALPGDRSPYYMNDHRVLARLDGDGRLLLGATCTSADRPEDLWFARLLLGGGGTVRTVSLTVAPTVAGLVAVHRESLTSKALDPTASFTVSPALAATFGLVVELEAPVADN